MSAFADNNRQDNDFAAAASKLENPSDLFMTRQTISTK